jgi:glucose uptake protein
MILPGSFTAVLIFLIAGMLGWGMWANTFKASGVKWRFELFYFDFAIGAVLIATLVALTVGSLGFDGFSFKDDLQLAGKRQELFGFLAGGVFNLGNMLLLGAVSLTGMAVAFPAAMGLAMIVAGGWSYVQNPGGNVTYLLAGAVAVALAIVFDVLAFKTAAADRLRAQIEAGAKPRKQRKASLKGVFLGLAGGFVLGSFGPLVQLGRAGENGLGPYSIGFMFSIGILISTFVFNLFFMNLPVQGDPVDIGEYFKAKGSRHGLGLLGGVIWYIGMIASLVAPRAEGAAQVSPQLTHGLLQGGIVIAVICGVYFWGEYTGTGTGAKIRLGLMLLLLLAGIGLLSAALAPAPA